MNEWWMDENEWMILMLLLTTLRTLTNYEIKCKSTLSFKLRRVFKNILSHLCSDYSLFFFFKHRDLVNVSEGIILYQNVVCMIIFPALPPLILQQILFTSLISLYMQSSRIYTRLTEISARNPIYAVDPLPR